MEDISSMYPENYIRMLPMDDDPLIRFADSPAGQRARIAGTGKDVWEEINDQQARSARMR